MSCWRSKGAIEKAPLGRPSDVDDPLWGIELHERHRAPMQALVAAAWQPSAAAAQAKLSPVPSQIVELGYDIRKAGGASDPRGSHCGAGAPRFDIFDMSGAVYFLGCNSPAATSSVSSATGWTRLRWSGMVYTSSGALVPLNSINVASVFLIFDEGQDTGPDNMGMAVLDNIDVNGTLVGHSG